MLVDYQLKLINQAKVCLIVSKLLKTFQMFLFKRKLKKKKEFIFKRIYLLELKATKVIKVN